MAFTSLASAPSTLRRFRGRLAAENYFYGKLLAASAAGIIAIILLAAIFLVATQSDRHAEQVRDANWGTLRSTGYLQNDLTAVEAAQTEFLVSGDADSLAQFRALREALFARLTSLWRVTSKESPEGEALSRYEENYGRWEKQILPQIAARERGRDLSALSAGSKARLWLKAARSGLANFAQIEAGYLEKANAHALFRRILQTSGFVLLCGLAIVFLIASSWCSFRMLQKHLKKFASAEEQTRAIVTSTLDGVLTVDESGVILTTNPAAENIFALPGNSSVGRNISELIPQRLFSDEMAGLVRGTVTAVGQREGQYPFPIEVSMSEMRVDGVRQFVLIVRDIAERKRGEETLKYIGLGVSATTGVEFLKSLSQELSRVLRCEYAFVVELHRREGRTTSTLTLAERGEIHSSGPFELYGSACSEVLDAGFRAYLGGARARFPEDALLAGLEVDTLIAMPLFDHQGKAVGLMGVLDHQPLKDVQIVKSTLQIFAARAAAEIERKRFQEDLAAEKERLAVTLRSIGDGFITTDNKGSVLMLNNVAERLTGWSQEQAAGRQLTEVFRVQHERTQQPLAETIMRVVERGSAEDLPNTVVVVALDASERLIETNASPIRDQYNQKIGVVLVFRDVTERVRAEEERRKNEKLESLGIAAGGIAHDFNNLLTAILGNVSLALVNANPDLPATERLVAAKKASMRAQELAQQLLTFAKGGAPVKQTASISQLVRDTVTFSLRGSNVRSDFMIADDLWPAEVDAGQISQVVQNLAINADQAMPAGGTLRVDCGNLDLAADNPRLGLKAGRYLRITVRDEGIGIPEEHLKKIFDPYFTTKPKGSGLGLATTYSIIKNHGGNIQVFSQAGEGTTFYIFLPASDKPVAIVEQPALEMPVASEGGRVLVLDDEDAICALVTCALEPLGYQVVEAYDSLTAIRLYDEALQKGQRFDLVISDLTIPGSMGGLEALKRLRELDPDVKAIVSSGYAMDPVMADFRQFGFCGMIAKPYEIDALGRAVGAAIAAPLPAHNVIELDFEEQHIGAA